MKVKSEFSKHANEYAEVNTIQQEVVQKLLASMTTHPKNILDLGCGSGAICRAIEWEFDSFIGIDFADGMLQLHPKSDKIVSNYGDFNSADTFDKLAKKKFDHIFSASALQWATDLEKVFEQISLLSSSVSLAIFTSGTFQTLHQTALLDSLLLSKEEINRLQQKYFDANFEVITYRLEFQNVREMFKYIKRSGVSGSRNVLSFKETKKLMRSYPLHYLEFEVAFITSR